MSVTETVKKDQCLWCGNNPTSHLASRVDALAFLVFNPMMQWVVTSWLGRPLILFIDVLFAVFLWVGQLLGFVVFEPMLPPFAVERGGVIAAEAYRRGYTMEVLKVGKRRHDTYRLRMLGHEMIFAGVPRLDRVQKVACGWIDDKWLLKQRLMQHTIPVSNGQVVYSWYGAKKVFEGLQKPVIVKPRFGSRGRHTTTHINTEADLRTAYRRARQLSWPVIVEEHLVGSVYRATCISGKVVGILAGDPPRVTGDGIMTVRELIEQKNATRDPRQGSVKYTEKLDTFLASLGLTLDSVIPSGYMIDLSEKIGLSYGGKSREMIDTTHPALLKEFEEAAAAVADPIIGFDFISTDVTADPSSVRWGVIECNSVPFINLHHDPLEGTPADAAGALIDYLEREIKRTEPGHTKAWWLFVAAALFFAFIPVLWYVPYLTEKKEPVQFGQVVAVDGDFVTIKLRQQETIVVQATASTSPLISEALVGERVMFTIDRVRDNKKELTSLEILPERPRRP
ncbi:MAG: Cyanophycin synthetase [Candidatus Parcubacteria bacterium]|jgi:D-alanine-D-alanine ligase-like ATP-grasp enzyme